MANHQMIDSEIHATFSEMQYLIRLISSTQNWEERNIASNQFFNKMFHMKFLVKILQTERDKALQLQQYNLVHPFQQNETITIPVQGGFATGQHHTQRGYGGPLLQPPQTQSGYVRPLRQQVQTQQGNSIDQIFTREQLMQYTGMNGMPAYVAVNGIVYDVTNNAAWSLATHFGLRAGRDLTAEFASCHPGQQWILAQLKAIGRLV